ncbi:CAF17-like 4Fe-4S cluster assembly/insertion protein YgfZ [Wenzhouxiangella sp. EGI_FJ10305]|uniref:CAF17-like 4Fe-4S cluster assembly/insertion protein YgfZ n=1 Tax=Wenzhouxiangella sp. EGI_FJ10305 TaxID=3243768 RepID=UPI0035DD93B1
MSNQFSLNHLRSCSIEGPEALDYAQSQFTVGIESLSDNRWSPTAWCDPKGRVISFMMARRSEDGVDLVLPAVQVDTVRERLRQFTIGRKVRISGPGPVAGSFQPDPAMPTLSIDLTRGMRAHAEAHADDEMQQRWQRLDLCRGLPWLDPSSSQQHLPQWLGLEELGALAYDKGCYPGQEVIARLHYRGSIKYRLVGMKCNDASDFPAHARVTDAGGNGVGHCLGGMNFSGEVIGLAVLSTRIEDGSEVFLHAGDRSHSARVTPPEGLC